MRQSGTVFKPNAFFGRDSFFPLGHGRAAARRRRAIPIVWHYAILIEIAGTSLDKPGDDAMSFARVTHVGGNCFSLNAFRLMVCSRIARRFRGATFTLNFR